MGLRSAWSHRLGQGCTLEEEVVMQSANMK